MASPRRQQLVSRRSFQLLLKGMVMASHVGELLPAQAVYLLQGLALYFAVSDDQDQATASKEGCA